MPATAAYQYTTDSGNIYQVVLPTDFAAALGESPATGVEPYLPESIFPRFATYQSLSPLSFRSAVVTLQTTFSSLPQTLAVGGVSYVLKSAIGESIPANPYGGVMLATGVQGPPGAAGATGATGAAGTNGTNGTNADIITFTRTVTSAEIKTLHASPVTLIAAPGASKYIMTVAESYKYIFGGTAYTSASGTVKAVLSTANVLGTVFLNVSMVAAASSYRAISSFTAAPGSGVALENQPYMLYNDGAAEFATGNGTIKCSIDYRIVDFS